MPLSYDCKRFILGAGESKLTETGDGLIIPQILYKYRPSNRWAKELIETGGIRFSVLQELNDALEGAISVSASSPQDFTLIRSQLFEQAKKKWPHQSDEENLRVSLVVASARRDMLIEGTATAFENRLKGERNSQAAVLCLTERCDNLPMWTYYADECRGVCIGLRTSDRVLRGIKPVRYAEDAISYDAARVITDESFRNEAPWLNTKSAELEHEREWRKIAFSGSPLVRRTSRTSLAEVILGPKMPLPEREQYRRLLENRNVQLFEAIADAKTRRIVVKSIPKHEALYR